MRGGGFFNVIFMFSAIIDKKGGTMKKISILIATLALAAGVLAGCAPLPFVNPGDFLGGGGTGDAAEGADDVTEDVKEDFSDSDFSDLSGDVSSEGATVAEPTAAVYPISASGTYLFRGSYGGILFTEKTSTCISFLTARRLYPTALR